MAGAALHSRREAAGQVPGTRPAATRQLRGACCWPRAPCGCRIYRVATADGYCIQLLGPAKGGWEGPPWSAQQHWHSARAPACSQPVRPKSSSHGGQPVTQFMAYAMAHKGKAKSDVSYNPDDPPSAYSNTTVHSRLSQYTEMARAVHGPEYDPSAHDFDGEIVMRVGGGKKHGRYWMGDGVIDTSSTPTLSQIRARSTSASPAIRPRPTTASHLVIELQAQLLEERRLREEMEARAVEEREAQRQRIEELHQSGVASNHIGGSPASQIGASPAPQLEPNQVEGSPASQIGASPAPQLEPNQVEGSPGASNHGPLHP